MELALVNLGISLLETFLPSLLKKFQSGEITPEDQLAVRTKFLAVRGLGDAAFQGQEWNLSTAPQAPGTTKTTVTTTTIKTP